MTFLAAVAWSLLYIMELYLLHLMAHRAMRWWEHRKLSREARGDQSFLKSRLGFHHEAAMKGEPARV
jgi:heme exporter protein D